MAPAVQEKMSTCLALAPLPKLDINTRTLTHMPACTLTHVLACILAHVLACILAHVHTCAVSRPLNKAAGEGDQRRSTHNGES